MKIKKPLPPPPPAPGTTPSGIAMPTIVPAGYQLQLAEPFDTPVTLGDWRGYPASVLGGTWSAYPSGQPDTAKKMGGVGGVHRPEKVISVHDSMLDLWLHTEDGEHCVAAPRPWPGLDRFTYGRVEFCFWADKVPGFYGVPLFWPTSENWPHDGEIDFPEGDLSKTIKAFMHKQNATSGSDQSYYDSGVYHGAWHVAVTDWAPTACTFTLDGVLVGKATDRVPNTEMRWVAQIETTPGSPPTDTAQAHFLIDWVRLLRYVP